MSAWYKREPAAFINGVVGLGPEVIGAYTIILDLIYQNDGPIQNDARWIGGILGCSSRKAATLIDFLIERGKLVLEDGKLSNPKAAEVIEARAKNHRELSEAGAKGGRKGREAVANQQRTEDENNDVSNNNNDLEKATLKHLDKNREDKKEREKETPNGVSKKAKGTRLPEDWNLTAEQSAFAQNLGFSEREINLEAEKFRDFWRSKPGQAGVKLDWTATWRNWCRSAAERRGLQAKQGAPSQAEGRDPASFSVDEWRIRVVNAQKGGIWPEGYGNHPKGAKNPDPDVLARYYFNQHQQARGAA